MKVYQVTFSCGDEVLEVLEVWFFSDDCLTSHRFKMICNALQGWQYLLIDDESKYIAFAIENDVKTVITGTETLISGVVYRTIWETRRRYNVVYRKSYSLGGAK